MPGFVGTQLSITNLARNYNSRLTYGSLNRPATSAIMALALVQFEWTDWMLSKFPSLYIVSTIQSVQKIGDDASISLSTATSIEKWFVLNISQ